MWRDFWHYTVLRFRLYVSGDLNTRTIKHIILVDTQRMTQLKHVRSDVTIQIIDHHPSNNDIPCTSYLRL